jgi:hypothetical protein
VSYLLRQKVRQLVEKVLSYASKAAKMAILRFLIHNFSTLLFQFSIFLHQHVDHFKRYRMITVLTWRYPSSSSAIVVPPVKLLQFVRGVDGGKMGDCWEMRWDQLVLSSEQLGRGVFGEVRKGVWRLLQ